MRHFGRAITAVFVPAFNFRAAKMQKALHGPYGNDCSAGYLLRLGVEYNITFFGWVASTPHTNLQQHLILLLGEERKRRYESEVFGAYSGLNELKSKALTIKSFNNDSTTLLKRLAWK